MSDSKKTLFSFRSIGFIFLLLLLNACKSTQAVKSEPEKPKVEVVESNEPKEEIDSKEETEQVPEEMEFVAPPVNIEEFRAAWIATVANINWPSRNNLSTNAQKQEAIEMLEILEKNNFNAVILQVRPQADALYKSDIEPWSYFLTGKSGKAPEPYYDPLEFWIEESHARGMELHVWLNPYRAHHTTGKEIGEKSIVNTHPELVRELKNGMWWMDPGSKEVQEHSAAVVMDIVKRYDIDGVHFDDYFYPYASYNGKKDFPDEKSWQKYLASGGELSRGDWRRKNVNDFVERIAEDIKAEKSFVKFGISPFGIWRPGFPKGINGMDQYEELYADAKLWLNKGWIDYFTPQLYWPTRQVGQSFPVLLGWWESENVVGRHVWPGINLGLEDKEENKGEIASQILISRGILRDNPGTVHWNIGPLMKNDSLAKSLKNGPYLKNAIVPASPWLDDEAPTTPNFEVKVSSENIQLKWVRDNEDIFRSVVYYRYKDSNWEFKILNLNSATFEIPKVSQEKMLDKIGVTSVDRTGNQSSFKEIKIENLLP
ncbi:glycoside hydrolase family 10 protein [Christiangramia sp. SM2212]|uniref:Family 10 glycosylhydrolase n=1 Tax=Christiangramia sediminicola TaxID=3073267 RepID=A0ABU1ESH3_9FLAO|nr:family 10 glycosylhydrolase [Christiangramia sp. SM2212]MDR5591342.1 family 10 glycosylhydrolase [Christiangramia sp. SM2212]